MGFMKITAVILLIFILSIGAYYFINRDQITIVRDDSSKKVGGDIKAESVLIGEGNKAVTGDDLSRNVAGGIKADSVDLSTNTDQREENNNEYSADSTTGDTTNITTGDTSSTEGVDEDFVRQIRVELVESIKTVDRSSSEGLVEANKSLIEARRELEKAQRQLQSSLTTKIDSTNNKLQSTRKQLSSQISSLISGLNGAITQEGASRQAAILEAKQGLIEAVNASDAAIKAEQVERLASDEIEAEERVKADELEATTRNYEINNLDAKSTDSLQVAKDALNGMIATNTATTEQNRADSIVALDAVIATIEQNKIDTLAGIESQRVALLAEIEVERTERIVADNFVQDAVDVNTSNIDTLTSSLTALIDTVDAQIGVFESSAIVIISGACPDGWIADSSTYGRYLKSIDPSGDAAIGDLGRYQTALPEIPYVLSLAGNHSHSVPRYNRGIVPLYFDDNGLSGGLTSESGNHLHEITGGDSTTEPDNISVLICVKT